MCIHHGTLEGMKRPTEWGGKRIPPVRNRAKAGVAARSSLGAPVRPLTATAGTSLKPARKASSAKKSPAHRKGAGGFPSPLELLCQVAADAKEAAPADVGGPPPGGAKAALDSRVIYLQG